jgi:hypothetical protein
VNTGALLLHAVLPHAVLMAGGTLGLGFAVHRWLVPTGGEPPVLGEVGFLGLFALAAIATLAHFVTPLTPAIAGLIVGAGWGALGFAIRPAIARHGGARHGGARHGGARHTGRSLGRGAACVAAAWAAALLAARGGTLEYDTGLYHLQTIGWIADEPVVAGLANLHFRLGYNSVWFPLAALFDLPPLGPAGVLALNLLAAGFGGGALLERLLRHGGAPEHRMSTAFLLLATAATGVLGWASGLDNALASAGTDVAGTLLLLMIAHLALLTAESPAKSPAGGAGPAGRRGTLVLLAVLAATVKLHLAPVLAVAGAAWVAGGATGRGPGRPVLALAAGLAVPWLVRGTMLSGCVFYPQPRSCLALPWALTPGMADFDYRWMRAWARLPGHDPQWVLADWSWLPRWAAAPANTPALALAGVLGLVTLGLAMRAATGRPTVLAALPVAGRRLAGATALFLLAGLAAWFVAAPLVRYGIPWLVTALTVPVALLMPAARPRPAPAAGRAAGPAPWGTAVLLAGLAGLAAILLAVPAGRPWPIAPPVAAVTSRLTAGGMAINLPVGGELCWAAPRPCTPYPDDAMRRERLGPWTMLRNDGDPLWLRGQSAPDQLKLTAPPATRDTEG